MNFLGRSLTIMNQFFAEFADSLAPRPGEPSEARMVWTNDGGWASDTATLRPSCFGRVDGPGDEVLPNWSLRRYSRSKEFRNSGG